METVESSNRDVGTTFLGLGIIHDGFMGNLRVISSLPFRMGRRNQEILVDKMTFSDYIHRHFNKKDGLRLGQRFWNDFIKEDKELDDTNLYNTTDDHMAIWLIEEWLQKHHYFNELPPKVR